MAVSTLEKPDEKKATAKPIEETFFVSSAKRLVRFRVGKDGFAVFRKLGDLIIVTEQYAKSKGASQAYINGIMRQRLDVDEFSSLQAAEAKKLGAKETAGDVGKKRDSRKIMEEKLKK